MKVGQMEGKYNYIPSFHSNRLFTKQSHFKSNSVIKILMQWIFYAFGIDMDGW